MQHSEDLFPHDAFEVGDILEDVGITGTEGGGADEPLVTFSISCSHDVQVLECLVFLQLERRCAVLRRFAAGHVRCKIMMQSQLQGRYRRLRDSGSTWPSLF